MLERPNQKAVHESPDEEMYEDAFFKATEYLVSLKKYPEKGWDEDSEEVGTEEIESEEELEYSLNQVMTQLDELRSNGDETAGTLLAELVTATKNKLKI